MPKLRFAQAGATALHATMYRETLSLLADEIELVGFYDPDPTGARGSLAPAHADLPFHDSIPALIATTRPDAILVSTVCREMPDWMAQVAGAGIHLWAEKPCAATSGQLAPVAAALASKRLHFSCGYSWRFHPIARLIKETYDAGLLGTPYSIEFRFITSSIRQRGPAHWLFDPALSGGGILNWLGCHWFDLLRFITGAEVTRVAAIEANVSGDAPEVEDAASVSLRLANGMIGSLHTGYFTDGDGEVAIALRGSTGWIKWDVAAGRCTIRSTHHSWATAPTRTFDIPTAKLPGYGAEGRALIGAFAAAIRGEGASGYTIDDPIRALQIIEAAHESSRTGRTIALDEQ